MSSINRKIPDLKCCLNGSYFSVMEWHSFCDGSYSIIGYSAIHFDEASRFHLGRQCQHSAVICSGALLFSSRILCPSLVTLSSHKSGRCAVELYHASHLWYPPFYTSPMVSVLSDIEPPALRRKAATDKLVEKIAKHDSWPIQKNSRICRSCRHPAS